MFSLFLLVLLIATMVRLADKEIPIPIDPGTPAAITSSSSAIEMLINATTSMVMSTTSSTTPVPTISESNSVASV